MASFKKLYRDLFKTFGYPLAPHAGTSPKTLAAAQKRLGVKAPAALADYYLVAGGERRLNTCLNRLLPPQQWWIDKQRLIFMEENQAVLWWGVSVRNPASVDPPISQGLNDDPVTWVPEHRKCSVFLAVMLHWHAVNDGLPFCGQADAPDETDYRFEQHGWTCYVQVNSLTAYSRPGQVICLMPPGNLPFMQKWTVHAAGKTKGDLQAIAEELKLTMK